MDKAAKTAIYIRPDGSIFHIYDDDMALVAKGLCKEKARRASHVELFCDLRPNSQWYVTMFVDPDAEEKNEWWVDLMPSGSKKVYGPFERYDEAIEFEVEWLIKNRGEGNVRD
jgi:hypothetical protein